MEFLSKLSPAEIYLLKENRNAGYRTLLKYTLIDLLFRGILKSVDTEYQAHENDPVSIHKYISRGPNYAKYDNQNHEDVYTDHFKQEEEIELLFRHLIKLALDRTKSRKKYIHEHFYQIPRMAAYFQTDLFTKLFGSIKLSGSGEVVSQKIKAEIKDLELRLPQLIEDKHPDAKDIISKIGANIFLINTLDNESLSNIDSEISNHLIDKEKKTSSGCTGCTGCYIFFGDYSDAFDTDFSSYESSSSGCVGDSGCSSCSGCSGCGGCGGCS